MGDPPCKRRRGRTRHGLARAASREPRMMDGTARAVSVAERRDDMVLADSAEWGLESPRGGGVHAPVTPFLTCLAPAQGRVNRASPGIPPACPQGIRGSGEGAPGLRLCPAAPVC